MTKTYSKLAAARAQANLDGDVTPASDGYKISIADAIADLIHLSEREGVSFEESLRIAYGYVKADLGDTDEEAANSKRAARRALPSGKRKTKAA